MAYSRTGRRANLRPDSELPCAQCSRGREVRQTANWDASVISYIRLVEVRGDGAFSHWIRMLDLVRTTKKAELSVKR